MLVRTYRARITLYSGQVIELCHRNFKTLTSEIATYEELDISSVVILKCRKVVSDGETA